MLKFTSSSFQAGQTSAGADISRISVLVAERGVWKKGLSGSPSFSQASSSGVSVVMIMPSWVFEWLNSYPVSPPPSASSLSLFI